MSEHAVPTTTDVIALLEPPDDGWVLSIYVDADPAVQSTATPAWEIELKNQLADLADRNNEEDGLQSLLERADDHLADVLSSSSSGRARAMFVSSGATSVFRFNTPTTTRAEFLPTAFIRPLLVALDRGAPAGLVNVSEAGLEVSTWRLGHLESEHAATFGAGDAPRERRGPSAANPARGQQSATHVEQVEAHRDDNWRRFLSAEVQRVAELSTSAGWREIVLAGAEKRVAEAAEQLESATSHPLIRLDANPAAWSADRLAEEVSSTLEVQRAGHRRDLARRIRGRLDGDERAAAGPSEVARALIEGRVETLVFDAGVRLSGVIADDGSISDAPDGATGAPVLIDQMAKLALSSSAEVVPLEPEEAALLGDAPDVAAELRW